MFSIEKSKNFLLNEIKVNNPSPRIDIIQNQNHKSYGIIPNLYLNKIGIELEPEYHFGVRLFKNHLEFNPLSTNEKYIQKVSNILNSKGIKNDIIIRNRTTQIKILSKYYNLT